jgi:Uncharacterized conserved protein
MENTLKIVAIVTIREEKYKEEVIKALQAAVDGTRREEGNISYDLHRNINDPLSYVLIEVWKSSEAIALHNQTPHFTTLVKELDGKADLSVCTIEHVY